MFNVIIAGTRTFTDYDLLCRKCDFYFQNRKPTAIICGEAKGADTLGRRYAIEHGINVLSFPADWDRYGKSAGYIRNQQMAEKADALIAFWNDESKGTRNMIDVARKKGLHCRIVHYKKYEKDMKE